MAATMTLAGDWLINIGNRTQTQGTGNLGTYATNGISVSAATVGLGTINSLVIDPAGGYTFEYVASTGKVKAYYGNPGLATHTHTLHFQTSAAANAVTAAANQLRTAAAAFDVAGVADTSGEGGVVAVAAGSPAAGTEVATSTNLAGITFNWRAIGY